MTAAERAQEWTELTIDELGGEAIALMAAQQIILSLLTEHQLMLDALEEIRGHGGLQGGIARSAVERFCADLRF